MTTLDSSFSAEKIANNQYLINDILLRVPAIPLVRLKCVSKQWCSIISDPKFCLSHTKLNLKSNSTTPTALFLNNRFNSSRKPQLLPLKNYVFSIKIPFSDYIKYGAEVQLEDSCNGLLLCSTHIPYDLPSQADTKAVMEDDSCIFYGCFDVKTYFICNPITKEIKRVYFPSEFKWSVWKVYLAFDPSKSTHYKLICLCSLPLRRGPKFRIDVYSSETDSWSLLNIRPNLFRDFFPSMKGVYYKGAIHWPPTRKFGECLYFDTEPESLKELPKPPNYVAGDGLLYFGESGGHLHIVLRNPSDPDLEFDVTEMASDYSEWSIRFHVDLNPVKAEFPELAWDVKGLGCSILSIICSEENEENRTVFLAVGDVVLAYNVYQGTSKKLPDIQFRESDGEKKNSKLEWFNTFPYFDSLFLMKNSS